MSGSRKKLAWEQALHLGNSREVTWETRRLDCWQSSMITPRVWYKCCCSIYPWFKFIFFRFNIFIVYYYTLKKRCYCSKDFNRIVFVFSLQRCKPSLPTLILCFKLRKPCFQFNTLPVMDRRKKIFFGLQRWKGNILHYTIIQVGCLYVVLFCFFCCSYPVSVSSIDSYHKRPQFGDSHFETCRPF